MPFCLFFLLAFLVVIPPLRVFLHLGFLAPILCSHLALAIVLSFWSFAGWLGCLALLMGFQCSLPVVLGCVLGIGFLPLPFPFDFHLGASWAVSVGFACSPSFLSFIYSFVVLVKLQLVLPQLLHCTLIH